MFLLPIAKINVKELPVILPIALPIRTSGMRNVEICWGAMQSKKCVTLIIGFAMYV